MEGPGMSEPQPPQVMEDVRPFKFSNAEVERYVDNALASLDESDKGAIVGYADSDGKAYMGVAARLPHGWSAVAQVRREDWDGEYVASAAVRKVWR
jgi:hypothetical protein